MADEQGVPFVTSDGLPMDDELKSIFNSWKMTSTKQLPVSRLRENLAAACRGLNQALVGLDDLEGYRLKRLTVSLDVDEEGNVAFVGAARAKAPGALQLTFERDEAGDS